METKLASLRASRALTQAALARTTGLARSYLAKLERGHSRNPSMATVEKIASGLNVPVFEVIQATASRGRKRMLNSGWDQGFAAGASAAINLTLKDLRRLERGRPLHGNAGGLRRRLRHVIVALLRRAQVRALLRGFKAA